MTDTIDVAALAERLNEVARSAWKDKSGDWLRHEGVSRLFEMGWNIPHVAAVSGHRGWQSLQRYTHLRNAGDKWANWKWLAHVSALMGE